MTGILNDIAQRFHLARKNGKWVGPCPQCGGSSTSDKFQIRDDGGFKCYSCEFKGDIITWLMQMDGKSCPAAHEAAGKTCNSSGCPAAGTCRFGDGSGRKPARRGNPSVAPLPARQQAGVPCTTAQTTGQSWHSWSAGLLAEAQAELPRQKAVLTWLASRGIDADAAVRFGLGWQRRNGKVIRKSIELPPVDGKETMWIPIGLVIPVFDQGGQLHRLRIRRPGWARENFLPDLKYLWIEGSGTDLLVIRPPAGPSRGTVVVEAELDAMACAAAHDQVTVIALGTVKAPITAAIRLDLAAEPVILVCLDADPGKDGKAGPGPAAVSSWRQDFRQAMFWPVPAGKDPGDYVNHGGDLRSWIEAGLPPAVAHDSMIFPVLQLRGGGGGNTSNPIAPVEGQAEVACGNKTFELRDGRIFHVVHDVLSWRRLTESGETVFSVNELQRLQVALAGCAADERADLAATMLDIKEVFPGAYVKRGDAV